MRFVTHNSPSASSASPSGPPRRDGRRSPPRNYLRRSNQWRLLVLVASFMLVLVLIEEARKPEHYHWMWGDNSPAEPSESDADLVIARIESVDLARHRDGAETLPVGARDAWQYAVDQLTNEQSVTLHQLLRFGRNPKPPRPLPQRPLAHSALDPLAEAWRTYLDHAHRSLDVETSSETASLELWEQLRGHWEREVEPALEHLRGLDGSSPPLTSAQRKALVPLQEVLDDRAMAHIRDNTPFRFAEREAWFRLIEQLQHGDLAGDSGSGAYVTYLQLLDQAKVYRGQWLRVQGTARWGYRVAAPENDLGIEHYYVLWLKPADGANSPIALYCLALPEHFPPLPDRTATGAITDLSEELDVGGVFFKRWAYRGTQGLEIAPLLLISEVIWYPDESAGPLTISWSDVLTALLGGLLLGVAGLWFAWRTIQRVGSSRVTAESSESPRRSTGGGQLPILLGITALGLTFGQHGQLSAWETQTEQTRENRSSGPLPWTRPDAPPAPPELAEILHLYGILSSDLASLVSNETTPERREQLLLNLLYHLGRLTPADWSRWESRQPEPAQFVATPAAYRGRSITVRGRATRAVPLPVPPHLAESLEFSQYWQVSFEPAEGLEGELTRATVFARRIPSAWMEAGSELNERSELSGAFLDVVPDDEGASHLLIATARLAWHPDKPWESPPPFAPSIGRVAVELAGAGVDLALWDDVRLRNGRPLEGPDRELFYQLLAAAARRDTVRLGEAFGAPLPLGALLLEPRDYQGELLTLTAHARRVTKVLVDDTDIQERFGIDHYYHIDVLISLDDKQIRLESREPGRAAVYTDKFPMTFCVAQIPSELAELAEEGVARGSNRPLINERIRVAGIFLKTWPFRSEFLMAVDPDQRHPSPLLIGTRPVRLPEPAVARDTPLELVLASLFVLALGGVSLWIWRTNRSR